MREPLEPATETFWERVAVALAAQGENMDTWRHECGVGNRTLRCNKERMRVPRPEYVDALCLLTGCTREFLFNPDPVDLSK